ncbi:MAG TPA: hypothetical protein VIY52_20260, partial [Streptosporangiaceae bacterium]
ASLRIVASKPKIAFDLRREPTAGKLHGGIYGGGAGQLAPLPDNHIGPEPCAGIREDFGEASAGGRAGQPLSRDRKQIPGADAVCVAEGNMFECAIASARMTRRGRRTWHARTLFVREPGDLQVGHALSQDDGVVRGGKVKSQSRR